MQVAVTIIYHRYIMVKDLENFAYCIQDYDINVVH